MAIVVQDSKAALEAFITDQGGEPPAKPVPKAAEPPEKPAETIPDPDGSEDDPDDQEDENGLTPRQKRELSAKMLKAIGKKHREMKEAEEFAGAQYAEKRLAEQRAEDLARQLEAERRRVQQQQPTPQPPAKPERKDFQTDDAYFEAVVQHQVQIELGKKAAEDANRREEDRIAEVRENAKTRINRAIELVPDFEAVTKGVDLEVPPAVATYMEGSELFAEIGYHFAKNPDVLRGLQKLTPLQSLVELGKIVGTLKPFDAQASKANAAPNGQQPSAAATPSETGAKPEKPRVSAPVITPLNGATAAQVDKDPREMNTREAIADWQRRKKANLGARKRH